MSKPVAIPTWDSGGVNLVAVTGTHQTNGFAFGEIPTSGETNAWMQNVFLWISWLNSNVATVTRNGYPPILTSTNWAYTTVSSPCNPAFTNNLTGTLTFDLGVPQGYKLSTLKFAVAADIASPGGALTVTVLKALTTGTVSPTALNTFTIANGAFPTTATDVVLNFLNSSTGLTVTVAAAGGTYTRSAGSFITDGFFVGQQVQWTGFVNGGNNALKTITVLTTTVMTVSVTGLVNETGPAATVTGVSPTVDDTFGIQVAFNQVNAGGHVSYVGPLRYTLVPQ